MFHTDTAYHNEELKSLTRYHFDKVKERAKLKQSVSRVVCILFPELEKLVPTLHIASVYALLAEFPGAKQVAAAHLTRLKALLADASKGRYGEIWQWRSAIQAIVDELHSPITTIPGIGYRICCFIK